MVDAKRVRRHIGQKVEETVRQTLVKQRDAKGHSPASVARDILPRWRFEKKDPSGTGPERIAVDTVGDLRDIELYVPLSVTDLQRQCDIALQRIALDNQFSFVIPGAVFVPKHPLDDAIKDVLDNESYNTVEDLPETRVANIQGGYLPELHSVLGMFGMRLKQIEFPAELTIYRDATLEEYLPAADPSGEGLELDWTFRDFSRFIKMMSPSAVDHWSWWVDYQEHSNKFEDEDMFGVESESDGESIIFEETVIKEPKPDVLPIGAVRTEDAKRMAQMDIQRMAANTGTSPQENTATPQALRQLERT